MHTSDGKEAIERIAVGDRVWSYDHWQLRWVERRVVEVYRHQNQGAMATIQVKGEAIRATGGHPFWVVDGEGLAERRLPERIGAYEVGGRQPGRWVLAIDLRAGDKILRRDGEVSALDSVEVDETEETVYNFRVLELQNYAVGACGILVHNTNQGVPSAASSNAAKGFGNIGSHGPVSPDVALRGAEKFLGPGYKEIEPGVFRSADGLRQFRMTTRDLLPTHGNIGPHVHFEIPNPSGGPPLENLHLPITP